MASSTLHFNSLLLLLVLPHLPTVFTIKNSDTQIELNLSLPTGHSWNSLSNEFAFGLRNVQLGEQRKVSLLAIWFTKDVNQTIVWFSRDAAGSTVNLNNKGVAVYDQQGDQIWRRPNPESNETSYATMQDNGNFVLHDKDGNHLWESFQEPTDTILPGQKLNLTKVAELRARKSETDFSEGDFGFHCQDGGNLLLYYIPERVDYWDGRTLNSNADMQLFFNESGEISIRNQSYKMIITKGDPDSQEYRNYMARIDSDGGFRLYQRSRSCDTRFQWEEQETFPPGYDICFTFLTSVGGVFCGLNSYCEVMDKKPQCSCVDGYSFVDRKSCRPNFPLPSCQEDGWEKKKQHVQINEYINIDWPLSDYDYQMNNTTDKDYCRQQCLDDCFCAVAIYTDGRCWRKRFPLSNGRKGQSVNRIALVKVPTPEALANLKMKTTTKTETNKDQSTLVLVISILLGSSVFFNILLLAGSFVAFSILYHRKLVNLQQVSSLSAATVRRFTYKELEEATRGFQQTLGRGAFGTVYKGVLASDTTRYVAVKKLDKVVQEGEKEFKTEVSVIGQTHHRNLVRLLGYCDEGEHRLLVYEYMSNGSLASFLFGISRPHWNQRVQIALGIAKGLTYLHEECSTQIIHCDIKPQNILLDELFTSRISDFGLAKLLLTEQTRTARTNIRGTIGYFAPEWFRKSSITTKVDVYSFGVMLLEIICCKSSAAFSTGNEEGDLIEWDLIDWAYDCYSKRKLAQLVDNDEEAKNDEKRLEKFVMVAIWCIQEDPSLRPSMKKVTQMLEGVTEVSVPPRPSLFNSS
ncbi:hypothetical protein L6164_022968 [Bauhinia variegata]|uniref:Uncharacterized protein n=1 Tax=Bauhinia variegata TaxID=167791 RepID=A0ACB9MHD6_BAUVA|nr:hypothetical protein L6164_022968 [Bauhinia variegata]